MNNKRALWCVAVFGAVFLAQAVYGIDPAVSNAAVARRVYEEGLSQGKFEVP